MIRFLILGLGILGQTEASAFPLPFEIGERLENLSEILPDDFDDVGCRVFTVPAGSNLALFDNGRTYELIFSKKNGNWELVQFAIELRNSEEAELLGNFMDHKYAHASGEEKLWEHGENTFVLYEISDVWHYSERASTAMCPN